MGGAQYRRDIMSTVGGYLEYRGGYLEYCGGYSIPWEDIMMHMGEYHEYCGGNTIFWYLSTPTVLNTHDIPSHVS